MRTRIHARFRLIGTLVQGFRGPESNNKGQLKKPRDLHLFAAVDDPSARYMPHQGKRECARRVAQAARAQA